MGNGVSSDLCSMASWEDPVGGYTDGESLSCEAITAPAAGAPAEARVGGLAPDMGHPGDGVDPPDFSPYAEASVGENGDIRVGAALLRGTDPTTGISAELIGGSIEAGSGQANVHAGMADFSAGRAGSNNARMNVLTMDGGMGTKNPDGSEGLNVGGGITVAGAEGTWHPAGGGTSVTGGLSLGASLAGSAGLRDADQDGKSEACLRISAFVVTAGVCMERPW